MFPWYIRRLEGDYSFMKRHDSLTHDEILERGKRIFEKARREGAAEEVLLDYADSMVNYLEENKDCRTGMEACVEMMAGFMSAYEENRETGSMDFLRKEAEREKRGIRFLKGKVEEMLKRKDFETRNVWREVRVLAMDAYTITVILSLQTDWVVLYAGNTHVSNVREFLEEEEKVSFSKTKREDLFCDSSLMTCVEGEVREEGKKKTLILLGENHRSTSFSFAKRLGEGLKKKWCEEEKKKGSLSFLVEKHPVGDKDWLQKKLACQGKASALKELRCNILSESPCPNLIVIPVDTRHVDMGLMRAEAFDLGYADEVCRKKIALFQEEGLKSLLSFCEGVLSS